MKPDRPEIIFIDDDSSSDDDSQNDYGEFEAGEVAREEAYSKPRVSALVNSQDITLSPYANKDEDGNCMPKDKNLDDTVEVSNLDASFSHFSEIDVSCASSSTVSSFGMPTSSPKENQLPRSGAELQSPFQFIQPGMPMIVYDGNQGVSYDAIACSAPEERHGKLMVHVKWESTRRSAWVPAGKCRMRFDSIKGYDDGTSIRAKAAQNRTKQTKKKKKLKNWKKPPDYQCKVSSDRDPRLASADATPKGSVTVRQRPTRACAEERHRQFQRELHLTFEVTNDDRQSDRKGVGVVAKRDISEGERFSDLSARYYSGSPNPACLDGERGDYIKVDSGYFDVRDSAFTQWLNEPRKRGEKANIEWLQTYADSGRHKASQEGSMKHVLVWKVLRDIPRNAEVLVEYKAPIIIR